MGSDSPQINLASIKEHELEKENETKDNRDLVGEVRPEYKHLDGESHIGSDSQQINLASIKEHELEKEDKTKDGDAAWKDCIQSKNVVKANELLQAGSLPDMNDLQDAYIAFRDEHKILLKEICQKVEEKISNKADDIVNAQASYEFDRPDKIKFVVYTADTRGIDTGYHCHFRRNGECSEGDTIIAREKQEKLSFGKAVYQELAFCLRMHSPELMEKHSNLINTSVSHFKSSKKHGLQRMQCVVLYVYAKGFIPFGEEALPKTLKAQSMEFRTDIREGRFAVASGGPTEEHKDLKTGCRIEPSGSVGQGGTIGGFFNHPEHGLCAVTCAHVVLNISEFEKLLKGSAEVDELVGKQCFQPQPPSVCGEVVDLKLFSGTQQKGGMDIAFVKVDKERHPKTEEFPDILKGDLKDEKKSCLGGLLKRKLKYDNCAVIQDPGELEDGQTVVKYGFSTNLTSAKCAITGASVTLWTDGDCLTNEKKPQWKKKTVTYKLNDQIEIHDDGMNFCNRGDSGSLVFITDENNKLTALGILTGRDQKGYKSYATPIWRIFEEINSPIPYSLAEISNPVRQIFEQLDQYSNQISKLQKSLDDLKEGRLQNS